MCNCIEKINKAIIEFGEILIKQANDMKELTETDIGEIIVSLGYAIRDA